jgi:hypothetical protein
METIDNLIEFEPLTDLKIIKETLGRMGIANKKDKILYPTAYIYGNFDKMYLAHFKQLFLLSRKDAYPNVSSEDIERLNSIAFCLESWGLIKIINESIEPHNKFIFVLPFEEKVNWEISHKFNIKSLKFAR